MSQDTNSDSASTFRERMKWWFLLIMTITQFSFIFNMTSIQALQYQFQQDLDINEMGYSRILQVISIPGIIFPIVAGILADYYGASVVVAIAILAGTIGQLLLTIGIFASSYGCILAGFFIQQSGLEIEYLCKNKIIRMWFNDHEISRANSVMIVAALISMFACVILYPSIYELSDSLNLSYTIGSVISIISLIAGVAQIFFHERYIRLDRQFMTETTDRNLSLRSVKNLPKAFWIVCIATGVGVGGLLNAKAYESKFLQTKFNYSVDRAGVLLSYGVVASGVVSSIGGFLMDKFGRLPFFMLAAFILTELGIFGNIIIPQCDQCVTPIIPLLLLNMGQGIVFIVGISSIMRIVKAKFMGVSMAIFSTTISIFQLIVSWVCGDIAQKTYDESGYKWVFVTDVSFVALAVLLAVVLQIVDWRGTKQLQYVMSSQDDSKSSVVALLDPHAPTPHEEISLQPPHQTAHLSNFITPDLPHSDFKIKTEM